MILIVGGIVGDTLLIVMWNKLQARQEWQMSQIYSVLATDISIRLK